jgi:hypothetical protein
MNLNCKVKGTEVEEDMGYFKVLSYGFIEEPCKNTFRTNILQAEMTPEPIFEIMKLPYMLIHEMYKRSAFNDK